MGSLLIRVSWWRKEAGGRGRGEKNGEREDRLSSNLKIEAHLSVKKESLIQNTDLIKMGKRTRRKSTE